mmetsp:Transcript_52117/g.106025  ORF Transcript_52117/g.106025 Transcript_52117/m.106025 type:complete len:95 (-) Transcript_52117:14-298(-)
MMRVCLAPALAAAGTRSQRPLCEKHGERKHLKRSWRLYYVPSNDLDPKGRKTESSFQEEAARLRERERKLNRMLSTSNFPRIWSNFNATFVARM